MRIIMTIAGLILILLGALWIAQGSNLMPGTLMSGQSFWLWAGVAALVAGLVDLVIFNRRR
jgi:hypothetical protein